MQDDYNDIDSSPLSSSSGSNPGFVVNVVHGGGSPSSYSSDLEEDQQQLQKRKGGRTAVKPAVSPPSTWFASQEDSSPVYHIGTQVGALTILQQYCSFHILSFFFLL